MTVTVTPYTVVVPVDLAELCEAAERSYLDMENRQHAKIRAHVDMQEQRRLIAFWFSPETEANMTDDEIRTLTTEKTTP